MHHPTPPLAVFRDPSPEDIGGILDALQFAAHKHRNQRRKGEEASPYINHPIALANILWSEGGVHEPLVIIAALLHDTVEDTDTTEQELRERFGEAVARVVMEVTDDKTLEKAVRKELQVEHAPHISREAKLVKLADKISNLRDVKTSPPAHWPMERRREYFDWAARVVAGLRGVNPLLEQVFDRTLAEKP
jgi:GTP diphosphokinase / guanosine-3',5'-bis(diphosphate) 3'-diphosphatase